MNDDKEERHDCGLVGASVTRKGCRAVADFDCKEREQDSDISSGCCDCEWADDG
jgi:hypothetical protein